MLAKTKFAQIHFQPLKRSKVVSDTRSSQEYHSVLTFFDNVPISFLFVTRDMLI